jgi:hypothetical protein
MPKLSMMVRSFNQCSSFELSCWQCRFALFFSVNKSINKPADLFQVFTGAKHQQPLDAIISGLVGQPERSVLSQPLVKKAVVTLARTAAPCQKQHQQKACEHTALHTACPY